MTPLAPSSPPPARRQRRGAALVAMTLVMVAGTACGGAAATFDPSGPCIVDGQAAGAYPDLESRLPVSFDDTAPTSVDSGRSCSAGALGSLAARDVAELTFAGATWDLGDSSGFTSVVFAVPDGDLPAAWVAEFYETGARAGRKTSNIVASRAAFEGVSEAWRLDVINDLSLQTVVTWGDAATVRAVLVATKVAPDASREAHDALVVSAVRISVEAGAAGG